MKFVELRQLGQVAVRPFIFFSPPILHYTTVCVCLSLLFYIEGLLSGVGMSCNHEINTKRCICTTSVTTGHATFSGGGRRQSGRLTFVKRHNNPKMSPRRIPAVTAFFFLFFCPKVTTRTSFLFSLFHLTAV